MRREERQYNLCPDEDPGRPLTLEERRLIRLEEEAAPVRLEQRNRNIRSGRRGPRYYVQLCDVRSC